MMDHPENSNSGAMTQRSPGGSPMGPKTKAHWILSTLVVVVVLLCVWWLVHALSKPKAKPAGPQGIPVATESVKLGNIDVYLDGLGTVTPVYTVSVVSRVPV